MSDSVKPPYGCAPENSVLQRVVMRQVKAEWRESDSVRNAKAAIGRAMRVAIGSEPLKAFGSKGVISELISGHKQPKWLVRLLACTVRRRRFALALLEDDSGVVITANVHIDDDGTMRTTPVMGRGAVR